MHIYDARPYSAALGNKLQGKGYESDKNYKNALVFFLGIENIHFVRNSFKKMGLIAYSQDDKPNWLSQVEDSKWLESLVKLLQGAKQIVNSLQKGMSCLIHCSDGWDRTS